VFIREAARLAKLSRTPRSNSPLSFSTGLNPADFNANWPNLDVSDLAPFPGYFQVFLALA